MQLMYIEDTPDSLLEMIMAGKEFAGVDSDGIGVNKEVSAKLHQLVH